MIIKNIMMLMLREDGRQRTPLTSHGQWHRVMQRAKVLYVELMWKCNNDTLREATGGCPPPPSRRINRDASDLLRQIRKPFINFLVNQTKEINCFRNNWNTIIIIELKKMLKVGCHIFRTLIFATWWLPLHVSSSQKEKKLLKCCCTNW